VDDALARTVRILEGLTGDSMERGMRRQDLMNLLCQNNLLYTTVITKLGVLDYSPLAWRQDRYYDVRPGPPPACCWCCKVALLRGELLHAAGTGSGTASEPWAGSWEAAASAKEVAASRYPVRSGRCMRTSCQLMLALCVVSTPCHCTVVCWPAASSLFSTAVALHPPWRHHRSHG
jgi:hypothetical protein